MLTCHLIQHHRVQHVQRLKRAVTSQHTLQCGLVPRPPRVRDHWPVSVDPGTLAYAGKLSGDACPPVDESAEHIKSDDLNIHVSPEPADRTVIARPPTRSAASDEGKPYLPFALCHAQRLPEATCVSPRRNACRAASGPAQRFPGWPGR